MKLNNAVAIFAPFFLALMLVPKIATAGPYTDDLSKCLVSSTTPEDKNVLVRWIFATMALHPSVSSMASISDAERSQASKKVAALFETLLTAACKTEAQKAVRYEGAGAFESSFKVLGEIAARELFTDPKVAKGSADLGKFIDNKKIQAAFDTPQAQEP